MMMLVRAMIVVMMLMKDDDGHDYDVGGVDDNEDGDDQMSNL